MLLTETPPQTALPIYPFTETPDNQDSVLVRSTELLKFNRKCGSQLPILLIDNRGGSEPGYPGAAPWQRRLCELGVREESIMRIPFTESLLHTLSEAFATVRLVQERKWEKLVIVAPPFHLLRCFLSTVTAIRHLHVNALRVYCKVGITQPWHEHAVHSQKQTQGLRQDLIIGELNRILKYQKEGTPATLISTDEALAYLEWRDSR
jgi:hypothetical protein